MVKHQWDGIKFVSAKSGSGVSEAFSDVAKHLAKTISDIKFSQTSVVEKDSFVIRQEAQEKKGKKGKQDQ